MIFQQGQIIRVYQTVKIDVAALYKIGVCDGDGERIRYYAVGGGDISPPCGLLWVFGFIVCFFNQSDHQCNNKDDSE